MNKNRSIGLDFDGSLHANYCAFNISGDFILYDETTKIICIYSTLSDTWKCKRTYKLPKGFALINISKYDKLFLLAENYIYEWKNMKTDVWNSSNTAKQIFVYDKEEVIKCV